MSHVEQAIRDAVEKGGYEVHLMTRSKDCFLDPAFWQALGKARGWSESGWGYSRSGSSDSVGMPNEWMVYWHRFIDHLAEGKDAESFFKDL